LTAILDQSQACPDSAFKVSAYWVLYERV
jgi:hypothetical protein